MTIQAEPFKLHRGKTTKPTISDVARLAEVSVATVSYVLNNRTTEVSPATAERVMKAVRELNYVKNMAAASLSGQKSKLVAVIIPGIYGGQDTISDDHEINPFYGEFTFRLEHEARLHGYALCVHGGQEKDYVNFLIERSVDTAILVGVPESGLPKVLERENVYCVLYDSFEEDIRHSHVRTNEVKGGYLAAERLLDIKRRKIVFAGDLKSGRKDDVNVMRHRGAVKACELAEVDPIVAIDVSPSYEAGLKAAEEILRIGADGVVASADIIAAGIVEGLEIAGKRVPEDVAIVGYDNLPVSRLVHPQLTTIDQGLGQKVKAVVSMIRHRENGLIKIVDPKLVIRASA